MTPSISSSSPSKDNLDFPGKIDYRTIEESAGRLLLLSGLPDEDYTPNINLGKAGGSPENKGDDEDADKEGGRGDKVEK